MESAHIDRHARRCTDVTTSGGSVWDRGPSGDDDAFDETPTVGAPVGAPVGVTGEPAASQRRVPTPTLPSTLPVATRRRLRPPVRRPVAVLAGVALVIALGALAWTLGVVGGDDAVPAAAGGSSVALMPPVSMPAPTTLATTTLAPTTTLAASRTSTSTTSTSTTSTSTTSTVPEPVVVAGPVVAIVGAVGPCKFGNDCLIADFAIRDFETPQSEFVCEFENGSRYTFRFGGAGAEGACATSAADGTITIEVGGVRSETITR